MKAARIVTAIGFLGLLAAASGINADDGDIRVNFVVGIVSVVIMLIGLIKEEGEIF